MTDRKVIVDVDRSVESDTEVKEVDSDQMRLSWQFYNPDGSKSQIPSFYDEKDGTMGKMNKVV